MLFARQGVRATTLDEIGAVAGAGRSQLYHFFADKADLVSDVVRFQVDRVLSSVQPSFGDVNTAADLRAWRTGAVRAHAASDDPIRCPIGSLVYELDRAEDGPARVTLKSGFARWEQVMADALRRVADSGGLLPGTEPAALAAALLAAYQGGMLLADVSGDVTPLGHALDTVLAAAVGPPPKRKRPRPPRSAQ